jgi:hypothetical protein
MTYKTLLTVVAVTTASALIGCSGSSSSQNPYGTQPDFNQLQASFTNPTGTFTSDKAAGVFSTFNNDDTANSPLGAATSVGGIGGASAGTTQMMSLHILGGGGQPMSTSSDLSWCSALSAGETEGSCGCPSGGDLYWNFEGISTLESNTSSVDATLEIAAKSCSLDGANVNGTEFLHIEGNFASASPTDYEMVYAIDLTETAPNVSVTIDMDAAIIDGNEWVLVAVSDGSVAVSVSAEGSWDSSSGTGSIQVKDRNDTWSCQLVNGAGTCTGTAGATITVQ